MKNLLVTLDHCLQQIDYISESRKKELKKLATSIIKNITTHNEAHVVFICTHNSRRSQLAELWLRYACKNNSFENIEIFSAGTETTAFNHRMVNALIDAGFIFRLVKAGENPAYRISSSEIDMSNILFSKTYDHPSISQNNIIAVMVCNDAAENCPYIPYASERIKLSYEDPKHSDDTEQESETYRKKVIEIGSEMMYLTTLLQDITSS
jgi:protein-tyrosine-phosphatase